MSLAALLLAAAAVAAPQPESRPGAQWVQAKATAVILEPAIVRQGSGLEEQPDAPRPQVSRYDNRVLFEYQ